MPKTKYPLFKSLHRDQKGFTLIELLVVVAILGTIAAIVILNVGGFLGKGQVESANTEAQNVETAVVSYMTANSLTSFAGTVTIAPSTSDPVGSLIMSTYLLGGLQASYTIGTNGAISAATAISGSKWGTHTYTVGTGWH